MLNPFYRLFGFSLAYLAKPFFLNKTLIHGWLIDWSIASPPACRISAIFRKIYKENGRGGWTGSTNLECHWNSMDSWVGSKHLVFCSSCSTPTIFRNIQDKSLPCRSERLPTDITRYGPRLRFLLCNITTLHRESSPVHHPWMCWAVLWGWVLGTFTSTQTIMKGTSLQELK
jgi:hypothetical protein